MKKQITSCLLLLSFFNIAAWAANNDNAPATSSPSAIASVKDEYTATKMTEHVYEALPTEQQKVLASMWNLTISDYQHYLWLMQNTSNGLYYQDKHLDPSWILGMNAKDDQERQKYVVIAIKNERERITKELAFQREFTRLTKELFPNEKPINRN